MKNKILLFVMLLSAFSFVLVSCGGTDQNPDNNDADATQVVDKSGPEYTSKYICPMHCKGSGSDAPGKCPVCEMAYIAHKGDSGHHHDHDHNHDHDHDHSHDHDHGGESHDHNHDHSDGDGHDHDH